MGKGYVSRNERPGAFHLLFAFYSASAVAGLYICLDLLFGVRLWS
jgi:hypothetical protein